MYRDKDLCPKKISIFLFFFFSRYVGTDLYFFAPLRTSATQPIRSYVCRDQPAGVRPEITLLGWFAAGACNALQSAAYHVGYCDDVPVDEVRYRSCHMM